MTFTRWLPGMRITADRLNQSFMGEWKQYTPVWSTTTGVGLPSYGNSTVEAWYVQGGAAVHFDIRIEFGSTATFGSGGENWTFGLPVTSGRSTGPLGYAALYTADGSQTSRASSGIPYLSTADSLFILIQSDAAGDSAVAGLTGAVDDSSPYTWASGDRLDITGTYMAA